MSFRYSLSYQKAADRPENNQKEAKSDQFQQETNYDV
jgi:hypothetical protein